MVMIPNKREFLARGLGGLGIVRLLERLARRPGLLVLTYHRVGDPSRAEDYGPIYSATAEGLERTARALKRSHKVIGMEEAVALAEDGLRVTEPTALLTFDDGYRDNLEVALPLLRAQGIRPTFFLPTGFLEGPSVPWWDRIAVTVRRATVPILSMDRPAPVKVDLRAVPPDEAVFAFVRAFRDHPVEDEAAYFAELEDRAGTRVDPDELARARFLTWDEVRSLPELGADVGSHSHSHRRLSWLSEDEQRDELARSKRTLEGVLGREVPTLAYPYGWPGAVSADTRRLAEEAGYRLAFNSTNHVNRPGHADRFAVDRLGVGFADSPALLRARWAFHEAWGRSWI